MRIYVKHWALLLAAATLSCGCNYNQKIDGVVTTYEQGRFSESAQLAQKIASDAAKEKSQSQVVFRLEQGATARTAGDLKASNKAFEAAHVIVDKFDYDPDFKVTRETAAALTNLSTLEYRGYAYDGIMLNTYMALNYLELGQIDAARVEINRIYRRQATAVDRFRKRIDKRQEEIAKDRKDNAGRADSAKSESSSQVQQSLQQAYGDQYDPKVTKKYKDLQAYRDYVNPFSEYLRGLFYLHCGETSADAEKALIALKRVSGLLVKTSNVLPYIEADIAAAETYANGGKLSPVTYVFFETGLAPKREAITIQIPVFIYNIAIQDTGVDYVGAAFPKLEKRGGHLSQLLVRSSDGQSYSTSTLSDMDAIVTREFKNELPLIITKTIIATVTKAAIAYGLNEATKDDEWANILTRVSTTIYQASQAQADLRTWQTLPKKIQIARLPSPADGKLTLTGAGGSVIGSVMVKPNAINVVHVRSVQENVAPVIRQFTLAQASQMPATQPVNLVKSVSLTDAPINASSLSQSVK